MTATTMSPQVIMLQLLPPQQHNRPSTISLTTWIAMSTLFLSLSLSLSLSLCVCVWQEWERCYYLSGMQRLALSKRACGRSTSSLPPTTTHQQDVMEAAVSSSSPSCSSSSSPPCHGNILQEVSQAVASYVVDEMPPDLFVELMEYLHECQLDGNSDRDKTIHNNSETGYVPRPFPTFTDRHLNPLSIERRPTLAPYRKAPPNVLEGVPCTCQQEEDNTSSIKHYHHHHHYQQGCLQQ